ncbi:hypothetical protein [Enterovibrio paralichthyis]|uniref:hypothetical protein n=1 Tax=Enterovibrio paralichthyis TaxID=2853805 RepID=UPI001C446B18|nr:hypothetical protein [Enterovibrio paralichthyis]MBV7296918.1 hypothetical protein [Enterovibrio paralichthyis]
MHNVNYVKKRYRHRLQQAVLNVSFILFSLLLPSTVSAAILSVIPSTSSVTTGQSVLIDIGISGLNGTTPGSALAGFDFDISFDSSVFSFSSATFGDPTFGNQLDLPEAGAFPFFGDAIASAGIVDIFGISGNSQSVLDSLQEDSFRLFQLEFLAIAESASSDIGFVVNDPLFSLLNSNLDEVASTFTPGQTTLSVTGGNPPTPIPEPSSSFLLIALALFATRLFRESRSFRRPK